MKYNRIYKRLADFSIKYNFPKLNRFTVYSFIERSSTNSQLYNLLNLYIKYYRNDLGKTFLTISLCSYETLLDSVLNLIRHETRRYSSPEYTFERFSQKIEFAGDITLRSDLYLSIENLRNDFIHFHNTQIQISKRPINEVDIDSLIIYSLVLFYKASIESESKEYFSNNLGIIYVLYIIFHNWFKKFIHCFKFLWSIPFGILRLLCLSIWQFWKSSSKFLGKFIPLGLLTLLILVIRNFLDYDKDFVRMESSELSSAITNMTPAQQSYYITKRFKVLNELGYNYRIGDKIQGNVDKTTLSLYEYANNNLPDNNEYFGLLHDSRNIANLMKIFEFPGYRIFEIPREHKNMLTDSINQNSITSYAYYPELENDYYLILTFPQYSSHLNIASHVISFQNIAKYIAKYRRTKMLIKIGIPKDNLAETYSVQKIKNEFLNIAREKGVRLNQITFEFDEAQKYMAQIYLKNLPL